MKENYNIGTLQNAFPFLYPLALKNKILIFFFPFSFFLFTFSACNTTGPNNNQSISLALEDVSCTEAWLKLDIQNSSLPLNITLLKNNNVERVVNLSKTDTIIYVNSLQPNNTYTFQISSMENLVSRIQSNKVSITTLDTTSHNFTWQTWKFGTHSSSVLYDVAIINENNIYAVGEIYMDDSLGQPDSQPYAVAHWNGSDWSLTKVPYHDFNQTVKYPGPLFTITSIDNEIYSVSYANLLKWTGNSWEEKAFFMKQAPFNGQVLKLWGSNKNNIFCVGRNGSIYYFFGTGWQKISSETDLDIYDIFGNYNNKNKLEIYAIASKQGINTNKKILKIRNNSVENLPISNIPSSIKSIWFKPGKKYYVVGSGMFTKTDINSNTSWESFWQGITQYYTTSLDGNDLNDIIVCGSYGEMLHFNGIAWKSFQTELRLEAGSYNEVKIKDNFIIAVGYDSPKAVITIGRR